MRRTAMLVPASLLLLGLSALPAAAAETAPAAGTRGSVVGVLLGLALGLLFGVVIIILAERDVQFGQAPEHQEEAHDVREGFADHEV